MSKVTSLSGVSLAHFNFVSGVTNCKGLNCIEVCNIKNMIKKLECNFKTVLSCKLSSQLGLLCN